MKHDAAEIIGEATDENAESLWKAEIMQRINDLDNGAVKMVPWSEVKRQLSGR